MGTSAHTTAQVAPELKLPVAEAAELQRPEQEAAFFYGLMLRGHPLEELRRDIDVPREVVSRWDQLWRHEPQIRRRLEMILRHRRQVLAIFNTLVSLEIALSHLRQ